jgi:hypothetical protein
MPTVTIRGSEVDLSPMTREQAAIYRRICSELGLPECCPFRACRRARHCATRQVLCYQVLRQEINAMLEPEVQARRAAMAASAVEAKAAAVTAVTSGRVAGRGRRC